MRNVLTCPTFLPHWTYFGSGCAFLEGENSSVASRRLVVELGKRTSGVEEATLLAVRNVLLISAGTIIKLSLDEQHVTTTRRYLAY